MTRWKLLIEYDGSPFAGWQRQGDARNTVQEVIENAIFAFCQQRLTIHTAGRTDAGVHAAGQVAHFDLEYGDRPLSGEDLAKAINALVRPHPVAILSAMPVRNEFHARFDAVNKLYTYKILNRSAPPTLELNRVWHIHRTLDRDAMQAAATHLRGHHDFTTFRATTCQAKSPERTLDRLETERSGEHILIHAEGRSFLHHMVRNIVGTLALVGDGKWSPDDVKTALAARDRTKGGPTAPPDGLYLMRVDYTI